MPAKSFEIDSNPQKVGNTSERPRCGIQRGFVGVAVGDWQGGLSAATRAGHRKRKRQGTFARTFTTEQVSRARLFAEEEEQWSG